MKKVLLTAGALMLWTGTVCAADMVRIPAEDYRAIMKSLDTLQNRVVELETKQGTTAPAVRPAARPSAPMSGGDSAKLDRLADDINNIYDTLDQVETKTLKDKVNIGAEYRLRVDNYKFTDLIVTRYDGMPPTQLPMKTTEHDDNNWTNRFRINMDANISKSLKFHGRLAVNHLWGDSDTQVVTNFSNDSNAAHRVGDTTLKVERFYVDWIPQGFPVPVAITVGRHPSTEGPPIEFKENRKRQSTYPGIIFDGEQTGVIVTFGLESLTGLKNSGWRFGYGKIYHSDMNDSDYGFLDDPDTKDSDIFASFFETQVPGLPSSLMILSYAHIFDLPANMTEETADYFGTPVPNFILGDIDLYGVHFQVADVANSGLDLFVSGSINQTKPNDDDDNANWGTGLLNLTGTPGTRNDQTHTGWSVLAGCRYTLPINALNNPKLGFEYNHGSKYHFSMTSSAEEVNKFATRGDAYELYYIQPVSRNLFFRAGYTHIAYDYTGSGQPAFEPQSYDRMGIEPEMDNYYFLMDTRF